jgi:hypothetical protein
VRCSIPKTSITNGRKFLYDAPSRPATARRHAQLHIFGDFDSLAWDLGNPSTSSTTEPILVPDPIPTSTR